MNDFDDDDRTIQMSDLEQPGSQPAKQQISVPYLVMGVVFLGIATAWALHGAGVLETVEVQWLMPAILVVAGVAGLLASATRGWSQRGRT